jgi:hypothetical protein
MTVDFPPFYDVRSTANEYLILFCKILFHNGIQHLQFKVELLSKYKRLSALWKFFKAGEKVTVLEMVTVIGKLSITSAVSVRWHTSNTKPGADSQVGLCIWLLSPTCSSKATNKQYFVNKVLTTNVNQKILQNSNTSVYNVLSSVLYSDIHVISLYSYVMVLNNKHK